MRRVAVIYTPEQVRVPQTLRLKSVFHTKIGAVLNVLSDSISHILTQSDEQWQKIIVVVLQEFLN